MELFDDGDDERQIETYPGYLGLYFDGSLSAQAELRPLESFDFPRYRELVEEHGQRQLRVPLAYGAVTIVVSDCCDIIEVLDQLPTVTVYLGKSAPDWGPASGGIHIFFVRDGVSGPELEASINALADALKTDLALLERCAQ